MVNFKFLLLIMLGLFLVGCGAVHTADALEPDKTFILQTTMVQGEMAFVGVGGEIDSFINPDLTVSVGDAIRVVIVNEDGVPHDFSIPDFNVQTPMVMGKGSLADALFIADKSGIFSFFCSISGHRQAGMEGKLIVAE